MRTLQHTPRHQAESLPQRDLIAALMLNSCGNGLPFKNYMVSHKQYYQNHPCFNLHRHGMRCMKWLSLQASSVMAPNTEMPRPSGLSYRWFCLISFGTLVAFPREPRLAKPKANHWWPKSKYPTSQMCFPTHLGHI